jgi:DNA-binding NarL/FixJ family response regulator
VLIYTAYASPALTVAARAAQADGLVSKSEPAPTLIGAIRRIIDGESVLPTVSRDEFEASVARLDDTDLPIFAMRPDGAPVPTIAEGLRTNEREAARRAEKVLGRLRPRLNEVTPRVG